jgi:hypothetical protein
MKKRPDIEREGFVFMLHTDLQGIVEAGRIVEYGCHA